MPTATWKGEVIADTATEFKVVEGNIYFHPNSVNKQFLVESQYSSVCGWKGTASYYSIKVGNDTNADAAWYYKTPKDAAKEITGYVAFWKGVDVKK